MEQAAVNEKVTVDLVTHLIGIFYFTEPTAKYYALEILSNIK